MKIYVYLVFFGFHSTPLSMVDLYAAMGTSTIFSFERDWNLTTVTVSTSTTSLVHVAKSKWTVILPSCIVSSWSFPPSILRDHSESSRTSSSLCHRVHRILFPMPIYSSLRQYDLGAVDFILCCLLLHNVSPIFDEHVLILRWSKSLFCQPCNSCLLI